MISERVAVEQFLKYLNKQDDKKGLLEQDDARTASIQVSLHKIPNLMNEKRIFCKLPHTLHGPDNLPSICLIVKDLNKKERDYDKTVRKYEKLVEDAKLSHLIKMVMPLKQFKLEFRPYQTKRTLSTSFDMFLADKCLHEILYQGSQLGKEFHKKKKMPIDVDLENTDKLHETVTDIVHSTLIRLNGKGPIIDIQAFNSSHTLDQAMANIECIRAELVKHLAGGIQNIKSIHLKATNTIAVPFFANFETNPNEIVVTNNMTPAKKLRAKKDELKRLQKTSLKKSKLKRKTDKAALHRNKSAADRKLLVEVK